MPPKYVLYCLRASERRLAERATGSTFEAISGRALRDHLVAVAPLAEQRRIVAEIEKQFTRLEAAVVALKRVQANLKRYRASVLKAACEGRLVPTEAELARAENRPYETADKLLVRILKERRARWEADQLAKMQAAGKAPKDDKWKAKYREPAPPDTLTLRPLPEGWCWATIQQIADVQLARISH
jgi:type I restriction enzyme, S subunit